MPSRNNDDDDDGSGGDNADNGSGDDGDEVANCNIHNQRLRDIDDLLQAGLMMLKVH